MFSHIKELFTRPSGYSIAKSVRLRSSASGNFSRTLSAGTRTTWTWSTWVKRGVFGAYKSLFTTNDAVNNSTEFFFNTDDTLKFREYAAGSGGYTAELYTTQVFRDPSAWYHIVIVWDSNNGTSGDRVRLYVNGTRVTAFSTASYPTSGRQTFFNSAYLTYIGLNSSSTFDGYLTEINFIDGQALTPSSFGETDSITGVWKAKKYSGTYGTNGFYLNFSDNSSNTATTIGKDYSGNGNNWTPNNISVTAGATYDSMVDSPTVSAVSSNYCVLNPLDQRSLIALSNANLHVQADNSGSWGQVRSTIAIPTTGKWYWEFVFNTGTNSFSTIGIGNSTTSLSLNYAPSSWADVYQFMGNGTLYSNNSSSSYGSALSSGDILMIAFDRDNSAIYFGKNGTWFNSSNPATQTSPAASSISTSLTFFPMCGSVNASGGDINFGQRPFSYTPPTGFVALNTYNLPASTITNGAAYMAATTYTGNGSTQSISNAVGSTSFQPDFVWIKLRNQAGDYHNLFDSVRGVYKRLFSNDTNAENTNTDTLTAFNSNGFSVGTNGNVNTNAINIIGWQWKAGGTSSSNTNGSITSTVSVGATQGFSVVTYTGTGANATVGHGLGVAPQMIIIKGRDTGYDWRTYHASVGNTSALFLNTTSASVASSTYWNNTSPTSSVFSVGSNAGMNGSTNTYVAYCFAPVAGFSAFGSYTGNGSADGPFVYTGFRPAFIMTKSSTLATGASVWVIADTKRLGYNADNATLNANETATENNSQRLDILSNGFKQRTSPTSSNGNGETYIYMAFAENPFKYALAR